MHLFRKEAANFVAIGVAQWSTNDVSSERHHDSTRLPGYA
jgi:hypothetical protein